MTKYEPYPKNRDPHNQFASKNEREYVVPAYKENENPTKEFFLGNYAGTCVSFEGVLYNLLSYEKEKDTVSLSKIGPIGLSGKIEGKEGIPRTDIVFSSRKRNKIR